MSDVRRRFVRLSIFLLPALLILAALHFFRGDLREAAPSLMMPRYAFDGVTFIMKGRSRAEALAPWTQQVIEKLKERSAIYGFKAPERGFLIEVQSAGAASECELKSNRIVIRGIRDDAPWELIRQDLSRLIARTMLREGAPDADFSPWFEEGVSRFYEGLQPPFGSRKPELIVHAARNPPASLEGALESRGGAYFAAVSHSIIAFLHEAYTAELIAKYAEIERAPGSVMLGEFQRIFGKDVEKEWREFLAQRQKGS